MNSSSENASTSEITIWSGIDVSKHHWDVASEGSDHVQRFAAKSNGAEKLITWLRERGVTHACVEATGGYEAELVARLRSAGVLVTVVNPARVRDFARAHGQLAKTDQLDARILIRFAEVMSPKPGEIPSENEEKLRALRTRRQQVSNTLVQEKNRLGMQRDCVARRSIKAAIDFYQEQLKLLDGQIQELMQNDSAFQQRHAILVSVPGVGPTTAAALIAAMPELGALNRREVARLAGVAPINRDSGQFRGKRMIGGGRSAVRQALYMATLVATRYNPVIRSHYVQLVARGKAKMTALVACMRKLLSILNIMLKDNTTWKLPAVA